MVDTDWNTKRAGWAQQALKDFEEAAGMQGEAVATSSADLIADLLHHVSQTHDVKEAMRSLATGINNFLSEQITEDGPAFRIAILVNDQPWEAGFLAAKIRHSRD